MNQFTFEGKTKSLLFGGIGIGVLCMILTFVMGGELAQTRFWSNFLHNSLFFFGIAFMATFAMSVWITAWSGWFVMGKRVFEAIAAFMGIGGLLMLILAIGNFVGFHHLYHWNDAEAVASDPVLQGKSPFLNKTVYLLVTVSFIGLWWWMNKKIRDYSVDEDNNGSFGDFSQMFSSRKWAAAFLAFSGYSSAIAIWLWLMSVDAHWYSTLYAWYVGASWWVTMIAFSILLIIYLKSKGGLPNLNEDVIHDLGKFLFGFSIFWTYLWFSQYMLIWYGNVGEETTYFWTRAHGYKFLFRLVLVLNFPLPFLILMKNSNKRKYGTLIFTSIVVIIGHWLDFFLMIKPGVRQTAEHLMHAGGHEAAGHEAAHEAAGHVVEHAADIPFALGFSLPGLLEIGTFIGFLSLFLYVVFVTLSKANLEPVHDPFIEEAKHHHV